MRANVKILVLSARAETGRRAHPVGRRLLLDFIDCNVNSHDSQDELVLQKIQYYLSSK